MNEQSDTSSSGDALIEPPTAVELQRVRVDRYSRILVAIGVIGMLSGFLARTLFPELGGSIGGFPGAFFSFGLVFLMVMVAGAIAVVGGMRLHQVLVGYNLDPDMPSASLTSRDRAWLKEVGLGHAAVAQYLRQLQQQGRGPCRREVAHLRNYAGSNHD